MNNKIKKPVLFLVCLTATLATLSACSKKTTTTKPTTEKPITTEKPTTVKPTTTKKTPTGNPRVFFIVDGEIYQEVEYLPSTAAIVEPQVPAKAGYNIAKWSDYELNGYDLYVFALYYKANTTYTVEYYLQNLENDEYTLKEDDTQTFTTTPDKIITPDINSYDGFKCINTETEYALDEDSSKNVIKIYYDRLTYDINFDLDNGTSNLEYSLKYGATIPTIATPVKEGYGFTKYTVNGSDVDLTKPVNQSLNIKANYTANTNTAYTVKYYQENLYDDGYTLVSADTENKSGTTGEEASITVDPTKYAGFSVDTTKTVSSGIIAGDESLELSVYYKRNTYTVTYKYADGVTTDVIDTIKYGAKATNKSVLRDGYTFDGWIEVTSGNIFDFNSVITENYILNASYTPSTGTKYKVNVYFENANDDDYAFDTSYTFSGTTGSAVVVNSATYLETNFEFNVEKSNASGTILADGTLELNLYYKRKVYTLSFYDRYTSNLIKIVSIKHGATNVTMPEEFNKAGYTLKQFSDQTLGGGQSTFLELMNFIYGYNGSWGYTHDVKVTYEANTNVQYKIRVYYENVEDDNYSFGEELILTGTTDATITPENITGFTFDHASGYTEEDGPIIKGDGSTVIKAYYNRKKYTITFDTGIEGVTIDPIENIKYGARVTEPVLEKAGYSIDYWWGDYRGTFDFSDYKVECNENLECRWIANNNTKYKVNHYVQNIDDDEYTLFSEELKEGTTNANVYYYNLKQSIEGCYYYTYDQYSIQISGDGSSEINLYYKRNTYNVSINNDSRITVDVDGNNGTSYTFRYGKKVKVKAIFNNYLGYEYDGFYDYNTGDYITSSNEYEFTIVDSSINLTIKTKVKAEMENFYFTSDENNLKVTGLKQKVEVLTIPDSVTEIYDSFAYNDDKLKEVYIGKNVKKIDYQAFWDCNNLESVTFASDSILETIDECAFGCASITSISIPKTVKTIGKEAFRLTKLTNIELSSDSMLEEIDNLAFYESNIKEITIPSSLKKIGENVFSSLNMDELIIPATLEEIGEYAFSGSKFNTLRFIDSETRTDITCASFNNAEIKTLYIPKSIKKIEEYAFGYTKVEEIIFEEGSALETIGEEAFYENRLKYLTLPENLKQINEGAFHNGDHKILYVSVNPNILVISDSAFYGSYPNIILNNSEKTFTIGDDSYGYIAYQASYIFNSDEINHILIDNDNGFVYNVYGDETELLAYIGDEKEVTIPNMVTKIKDKAFYDNDNIVKVIIPDNVKSIGKYAFYSCSSLTSVTLGSGVEEILQQAFSNDSCLVEIINNSNLNITFKSSEYGYIGYHALDIVTDSSYSNVEIDNDLFIKYTTNDEVYLIKYIGKSIDEVVIPSYYTQVYKYAFNHSDIKKVTIGNGVKTIQENAFSSISNLEEVIFEENSSLEEIGSYAFAYDRNSDFKSLILPKSLIKINENAFYDCNSFESIIFEDDSAIEYIGDYAFYNTSIKELVLPNSLITVSEGAFSGCSYLEKVTLDTNLKTIGKYAFVDNINLKEVINNSECLELIDEYAFGGCSRLTSFTLNETLETINTYAFTNTNIVSIYNKSDLALVKGSYEYGEIALKALEIYTSIDDKKSYVEGDYIYYKELDEDDNVIDLYLISYIGTNSDIVISKDVTVIANGAFYANETVKNVSFEDDSKLRVIKESAFANTRLESLELPNSLEIVEKNACLYLDNSNYNTKDGAQYLGNEDNPYLFLVSYGNSIDENCKIIGDSAYAWADIEELIIPDSVTYFAPYAFYCATFGSITLSENIESISDSAFYQLNTESITIPKKVKSIDKEAFMQSYIKEVIFEEDSMLKSIDEKAFYECDNLDTIVLPDGLKMIGNRAFYSCDMLQTINIPDSVELIDEYAFYNCDNLENVTINEEANLEEIGNYAFSTCRKLTSITIPDSTLIIGDYAFNECNALVSITIYEDAELKEIGKYAFYNTSISSLLVSKNVLTIKEYAFKKCDSLTTLAFADDASIKEIGSYAFVETNINSIIFPDSLEIIDEYAFYYLYSLSLIEFTENSNLKEIGKNAFNNTSIEELFLPSSLESIKEYAFYSCDNLLSVITDTDSNLALIEKGAFQDNYNLQTLDLGTATNLKEISEDAFRNCNELTDIILPEGLEKIEKCAFYYSMNADVDGSIYLPKSLKEIGEQAFYNNSYLHNVYYAGSIGDWLNISMGDINYASPIYGNYVDFYIWDELNNDYALLTEINIPEGIASIREFAFYGIKNIDTLYLPASITEIKDNAFEGINNITKVYYGSTISNWLNIVMNNYYSNPIRDTKADFYIWNSGTLDYDLLTEIVIPEGVTVIKDYAFRNIKNVTTLYLPASLEEIGVSAFSGLNNIEEVYYNGTIEDWLNINMLDSNSNPLVVAGTSDFYTLDENSNEYVLLTEIVIPEGVTEIRKYAFYGIQNINKLYIPASVEKIDSEAFYQLYDITEIYYHGTIEDWLNIIMSTTNSNPLSSSNVDFYVFDENTNNYVLLTEIVLSENVTEINRYGFYNIKNITKLYLPSTLETVGYNAFYGLNDITEIYYKGTIESWLNINMTDSYTNPLDNGNVDFYIWNSVDEEYQLLTEIVIPEGVTEIKAHAFNYINNINKVYLPKSLETSGYNAFYGLDNITEVYYAGTIEEWLNINFEAYASSPMFSNKVDFYTWDSTDNEYKLLTKIIVPEGVTEIKYNAYSNLNNITKVYLPKTLEVSGYNAFGGLNEITDVYYAGSIKDWLNIDFSSTNSCPSAANKVNLYTWDSVAEEYKLLTIVSISEGITSIREKAFYRIKNINTIYLPKSLEEINYNAFYDVDSIANVYYAGTIEDWLNINMNGEYANPCYYSYDFDFYVWDSENEEYKLLTELVIPEGVTSIRARAFYNFKNIDKIYIPNSVTEIDDYAFYNMDDKTDIYYHGTLEEWFDIDMDGGYVGSPLIAAYANFYTWDSVNEEYVLLENAIIADGTTSINNYAFYNMKSVKSIEIPNSVTKIGVGAFEGTKQLTSLYYHGSLEEWLNIDLESSSSNPLNYQGGDFYVWDYDANDYKLLTEIIIPDSITIIKNHAFASCDNIKYVFIPSTVEDIKYNAFSRLASYAVKYYYEGTYDSFVEIDHSGDLYAGYIYYYSENEPTDEDYNYWHYNNNGEISEYKYEKALEALELLLDKSNEYLTGAVNGDETYVGDYSYTNIIKEDEHTYSLTFNALFHILSNDGYEELAQEIRNKSYLNSSSKFIISTDDYKLTFAIDDEYDRIINYYLTIDEDGNLVLDMFKQ